MDLLESPESALARVVVSRREQLAFRIGVAAAIAVGGHVLTGWQIALAWFGVYALVQVGEHRAFLPISTAVDLTKVRFPAVLAMIAAGTFSFGAFGLLLTMYAGPWGLAIASLVWSGSIVNGAMVNSGSRSALLASIIPVGFYFLSAPLVAFAAGASVFDGVVFIFAAALNMASVVKIWSMSRTLSDIERSERHMTHLTLHDPESGLPNRRALEQDIAGMLTTDGGPIMVVAALGIDRFTQVRGAIGYELFADLVREVAGRLASQHPDGRIVRLSTAELGLVFRAGCLQHAITHAGTFQSSLNTPLRLGENRIDVSLTVGLAIHGVGHELVASMVERATIALDQARAS
jgi:GGDEF domain-containing protein